LSSTTRYIALVDGKAGAYGVLFPDLPGCTAMGRTMDEALRNAMDAVREWAEAVNETNGGKMPRPRSPDALRADKETAEALADGAAMMVVPLIFESGRPAKANLSLDSGLLQAIDEAAAARGLTRSAFIASAAREKIASEG
jgi:predicted RNase H-like HicB family nuclease